MSRTLTAELALDRDIARAQRGRRARLAGWWVAVAGLTVLAALACYVVLELPSHSAADVTHYKYWTQHVAMNGLSAAYSGTYPETSAIYPPVTMYGYRAVGWVYMRYVDPVFDRQMALASHTLTVLTKLVAVLPYLVGIPIIFGLLTAYARPAVAFLIAAGYGLNPAGIFDAAFWGQPDAVHAIFLLIAIWLIEKDRPVAAGLFVGLAAATKPQAWALFPFLGYVCLRRFGIARSVALGTTAAVAALVVCLPYLVYGTFDELLRLPKLIADTMPVASANAHNIWWIATNAKPDFVPDAAPFVESITYRQAALGLALLIMGYGIWRTNPWASRGGLAVLAAYLAFGWFMVTTRAHENHAFMVLPLLAMALPRSRFLGLAFAVITLTLFLNMTLHDFGLEPRWIAAFGQENWVRLQLANAWTNVALLLAWTAWLWRYGRG
ncbi:MAG: hypothetical protein M3O34_15135 [Chloroflexota bacterium]|nr:hypothetical protein [Chloroflexota bacterium]